MDGDWSKLILFGSLYIWIYEFVRSLSFRVLLIIDQAGQFIGITLRTRLINTSLNQPVASAEQIGLSQ